MAADSDQYHFLSEEVLMERFKAGQVDAFRYIYSEFVKELVFFAEKIVGPSTEAEDIVVKSFYKLFDARSGLHALEQVKNWLYVTVRNHSIDHLRLSNQRSPDTGMHEAIETERAKAVQLGALLREIEKLPAQSRAVFQMYYLERKTTSEIVGMLGLSAEKVLSHKARALELIRKSIPKFDFR